MEYEPPVQAIEPVSRSSPVEESTVELLEDEPVQEPPVEESRVELLEDEEEDQDSADEPGSSTRRLSPRDHYQLEEARSRKHRRGGIVEKIWKIRLTKPIHGTEAEKLAATRKIVKDAVEQVISKGNPKGKHARISASHPRFHTKHVSSGVRPLSDLSAEKLLDKVEEIIQSDKEILLEDVEWCLLEANAGEAPDVGGRTPMHMRTRLDIPEFVRSSRCLVDPSEPSYRLPDELKNSCIINCTALGKEVCLEKTPQRLKDFIRKDLPMKSKQLAWSAGLTPRGPHDPAVLEKIQAALGNEFQVCVYTQPKPPLFRHGPDTARHHINLLLVTGGEHVVLIRSMKAFFGSRGFF